MQDDAVPLPDFTRWPSFPFEGDMRIKRLADPVAVEPPRSGEDAADCVACNTPDEDYIWVSERWRVRAMDRPTGLPMVLILECRSHLDMGDLPNLLAAELGVMTVRLERAIRTLEGVARVHVNRWGDGSAHLHMWFLARPYGRLQLRGTFLSLWDDILPVIPEFQWRENLALVAAWLADFGGKANAEPPHIEWQSPSTISDPPTAPLPVPGSPTLGDGTTTSGSSVAPTWTSGTDLIEPGNSAADAYEPASDLNALTENGAARRNDSESERRTDSDEAGMAPRPGGETLTDGERGDQIPMTEWRPGSTESNTGTAGSVSTEPGSETVVPGSTEPSSGTASPEGAASASGAARENGGMASSVSSEPAAGSTRNDNSLGRGGADPDDDGTAPDHREPNRDRTQPGQSNEDQGQSNEDQGQDSEEQGQDDEERDRADEEPTNGTGRVSTPAEPGPASTPAHPNPETPAEPNQGDQAGEPASGHADPTTAGQTPDPADRTETAATIPAQRDNDVQQLKQPRA